ncbi:hypothetical protein DdX_15219 [Ditylenchus destructor]|uniref:Uncharacterized protein n=1 Tax=Ditylenchus destructor TaxID=166010 RepID=A0AAD4QXX2_9BILA|nr:hypothetical protein DdX_15219 [Ditylenchus destructor]
MEPCAPPNPSCYIPKLQMEALQAEPADLYQVTEASAQRFIEESLLIMFSNGKYRHKAEGSVRLREGLGAGGLFSDRGISESGEEGMSLSARQILTDRSEPSLFLPPKSPRTRTPSEVSQLQSLAKAKANLLQVGFCLVFEQLNASSLEFTLENNGLDRLYPKVFSGSLEPEPQALRRKDQLLPLFQP